MAGGFSGMPLGSFSGRGADFQPFQFILEQRRLAAQAEAQRKQQAAAQQQSFVMALMQKKQQEAELAQQAQQFQASQQARAAEKQMAAEQFRAEQQRLRDAEQAQLELRKLGEKRLSDQNQRILDNQARDDERAALAARTKERDQRNLMGVAGDVGQLGESAMARFGKTKDELSAQVSAEIDRVERAMESVRAAWQNADPSGELPASEPYRRQLVALNDERSKLYERLNSVDGPTGPVDPLEALDKAEAALRFHASTMQDPAAKAAYLAAIEKWKDKQESEILRRDAKRDYREQRDLRNKTAADEAERKARADKNRTKIAAGRAELAGIKDDLDRLADDLSEARYLKDAGRVKEVEDEMSKLRKRRDEINRDLAELE